MRWTFQKGIAHLIFLLYAGSGWLYFLPNIITCLVSSITGIGMTFFGAKAYRFAGFGIFGYAAYANPQTNDSVGVIVAAVWSLIAIVLSFVLVYLTYSEKEQQPAAQAE